ncbi:hypothetical protein [Streptomyces sp. NPDC090025]|uniref:hypothetical protein n=1 Tax=Streptomyces sp. NPDC090025 TaxID=3365922 RepID=UPI0038391D0C
MHEQSAEPPQPLSDQHPSSSRHHATTAENGPFAFASCSCGWRGPARRSRDRARRDVPEHLASAAADDSSP